MFKSSLGHGKQAGEPWIWLKPFLKQPRPSEVVTTQPSSDPTGHKHELMLRRSTCPARQVKLTCKVAQLRSGQLVLDLTVWAALRQPVPALKLATCTAQAPQPPSEQASLVPCDHAGDCGDDCGVDVKKVISKVNAGAESPA